MQQARLNDIRVSRLKAALRVQITTDKHNAVMTDPQSRAVRLAMGQVRCHANWREPPV